MDGFSNLSISNLRLSYFQICIFYHRSKAFKHPSVIVVSSEGAMKNDQIVQIVQIVHRQTPLAPHSIDQPRPAHQRGSAQHLGVAVSTLKRWADEVWFPMFGPRAGIGASAHSTYRPINRIRRNKKLPTGSNFYSPIPTPMPFLVPSANSGEAHSPGVKRVLESPG